MNPFSRKFATQLLCLAAVALICATDASAQSKQASVSTPVTQLKFGSTGVSDGVHGELMAGPAYGDLTKGPHGTFIRMPAAFVSDVHVHTGDYWGVVISGVAANGLPGTTDVPLPVGSYWFQKGGEKHVTKCLAPHECLFFISQSAPFDYVLDQAKK